MDGEIEWKSVCGFPSYEVSSLGQVRSLGRATRFGNRIKQHPECILKTWISHGYEYVAMTNESGRKKTTVHRTVAQAFCERIGDRNHVNHKNGITADNRASNLEWMTQSENAFHKTRVLKKGVGESNGASKLTESAIREIRSSLLRRDDIARKFDIHPMHVSLIKARKSWRHVS